MASKRRCSLDNDYLPEVRRERGFGTNPWSTHSRFIVSLRLLIDETYAGPLRDWLGPMRPGSLLILDEAHHAAPSSGARECRSLPMFTRNVTAYGREVGLEGEFILIVR